MSLPRPCDLRPLLRSSAALALLALLPAIAQAVRAEGPPDTLAALVLHPRHRLVSQLDLGATPFEALSPFSELPFIAWPADPDAAPFTAEPEAVEAWLSEVGAQLGLQRLDASYARDRQWRGDQIQEFSLSHAGIPVRDALVHVHWRSGRLVGLVNRLPGVIVDIEALPEGVASAQLVYQPRRGPRGVELVLARMTHEDGDQHRTSRATSLAGELLATLIEPTVERSVASGSFEFREYPLGAGGTFPDQIDVDSTGKLWFSQPFEELIGSFQPGQERFRRVLVPAPGSGPDGLTIDRHDRLWTGLIYSGDLGLYDIPTDQFQIIDAPYSGAAMAIPVATRSGDIWVTDHSANRISRFNPETSTWTAVHVMPTLAAWVVAGVEDTLSQKVFFTEFNANQLAMVQPGSPPQEIRVPGSGPAFAVVSGRRVYYSEWNVGRIGMYDIETGATAEYGFPESDELGGPMGVLPNGKVVIGTRNEGRILVFDPEHETFDSYPIPTGFAQLKDGLTVDRSGTIWFTESGVDRIARLDIGL